MNTMRLGTLSILMLLTASTNLYAAQVLFVPKLSLSEEYTDNVRLSRENEEEEYISSVELGLTGQILGRTSGLELNYTPSYKNFARNSDLNYWRHAARVRVWNNFKRNSIIEFTDDYLETENPRDESEDFTPDAPLEGPAISVDPNRRSRSRYRQNISKARLDHQFGARDRIYTAFEYAILRDLDVPEGADVDDYDAWRPTLGVDYWFAQQWGLELSGYFSRRDYVDRNDRDEYGGSFRLLHNFSRTFSGFVGYNHTVLDYDEDTDEDYQIYEPSMGIRYQFQKTAQITIGAGYYIQDFEESENEEGWNVDSEIYKRWGSAQSYIDLIGRSGYRIEDTGVEDIGLNFYYGGRLEIGYGFSPRFSTSAYGAYRYDKYPNETPERIDKEISAGAGFEYQALQWMYVSLVYNYIDVQSDVETKEYTENNVILTFTLIPSSPFRLN